MNLKRIIIAITVVLIGTGNINAQDMKTEVPKISDFPVGEENTGYAQYFTGKSWLAPLTTSKELNVPMSNVTFEPGCRNNWHVHHATKGGNHGSEFLLQVAGNRFGRTPHLDLDVALDAALARFPAEEFGCVDVNRL